MSGSQAPATDLPRRVAVIGAGGFIGRAVCEAAVALGDEVVAFGPGDLFAGPGFVAIPGRIVDTSVLVAALGGVDILVHAAGRGTPSSVSSFDSDIAAGEIRLASIVLEAAARAKVGKVVMVSSGGTVYGAAHGDAPICEDRPVEPSSRYGAIKAMIEQMGLSMARAGLVSCNIARLSNPYGPGQRNRRGQGLVGTVIAKMQGDRPVEVWGDGATIRDYLYIDDAARGLLAAAALPGGSVCNVGSGLGTSVNDVIRDLESRLRLKAQIVYLGDRDPGVPCNILSREFLSSRTGWQPVVSWDEGLSRTVNWWNDTGAMRNVEKGRS